MAALALRYALLVAAVVALNFALPRLLPGNPLSGATQEGMPPLSAAQELQLRATYHLDQPPAQQFLTYVADLIHGDLGWSISRSAPVTALIAQRLPWTLSLVVTAVVVGGALGAALGLIAAWRGGAWDRATLWLSASIGALPEFLLALALLVTLSVGLGWFPLSGGEQPFPSTDGGALVGDRAAHLALPALTLVIGNLAAFMLLSRAAVRGVRRAPYLTTARAKGLAETQVALRHATPNAVLPVLTLFGVRLGQVLGGAIVVERVFGVPGLGLVAFQAIQTRDYPVLQAIFLLASFGVLLANFVVELVYSRYPRSR